MLSVPLLPLTGWSETILTSCALLGSEKMRLTVSVGMILTLTAAGFRYQALRQKNRITTCRLRRRCSMSLVGFLITRENRNIFSLGAPNKLKAKKYIHAVAYSRRLSD